VTIGVYSGAVFVNSGGLIVGASASIEVRRESDGVLASIFSDNAGASPLGNPFNADSNGRFSFFAAGLPPLGYMITITKDATSFQVRNQAIGTAQHADITPYGVNIIGAADAAQLVALLGYTEKFAKLEQLERLIRRGRMYAAQNLV
jgi:hypothetical protein